MANKLIWSSDLYKGFKTKKNNLMGGTLNDFKPFQMLSLEEKDIDWIKAVADFYDTAGWRNVERRAAKIKRNYLMREGKLNPNDYIINPNNEYSSVVAMLTPPENQSPLEQFYSLAPVFVDALRGEYLKRDNTFTIEVTDPESKAEMFRFKEDGFREIVTQAAMLEKQKTLAAMGIGPEVDPEVYEQEMAKAQRHLNNIELKAKGFRTTGALWAEKVIKIHEKRYNLHELEPDGFESGLITDSEFWHLDLLEDDFKLYLLNPMYCDYHKSPGEKYVSNGDYFLWFDFMSTGDIINRYGRMMEEDDIKRLREIYAKTTSLLVPDSFKNIQGSYYDLTKNWSEATDLDPKMNDYRVGQELAYTYTRNPNFDHNIDADLFDPVYGRNITGHPQMFRVMRLYWRSFQRIGWLTKINRDGSRIPPTWVDENFKVTVEPVYDNSVVKGKSKDNLLYGEHIDWTWAPQWRHVMKISPNHKHTFWKDATTDIQAIYIDGAPVKFQFKGRNDPFNSLPPIEGCFFSHINSEPHSFIDRVRPLQIVYNICMNKVPRKFLEDKGMKIAIDRRSYSTNTLSDNVKTTDPREEYEDRLNDSQILEYSLSREALEGLGQPALPQILNLSTVQEAQLYFQLGQQIKWEAGELVGISRQRLGKNMASDTATSINQGIIYSETQTEKYFEQHANLMQRVRQRMLDATQFYTSFQESSREVYMNEMHENVFLDIEGMDNLLTHYNINLESKANVRSALQLISNFLQNENTLPIKPSAKIESLVSASVPKILTLIKQSELEQEEKEAAQFEAEMAQRQKEAEIAAKIEQDKAALEVSENALDRKSAEKIAEIRALGGMQTDVDMNGQTDAADNLNNSFKQQELNDKRLTSEKELNAKKQTDRERLMVEREKAQLSLQQEKIRQEGALKVAKENKVGEKPKK